MEQRISTTRSVCPSCYLELAESIGQTVAGARAGSTIEAHVVESEGKIFLRKTCPKHGFVEDLLSHSAEFTRHIASLHDKFSGMVTVSKKSGQNVVVDLTNRCDMKCYPCFMNANQSSTQHELTLDQFKAILDPVAGRYSKVESNILLSGGEPTLSPIFLDAVRHCNQLGFHRVFAATNGIHFAQAEDFAVRAKESGLRGIYLQFDGATNEANRHRGVSNLVDVKTKAIDNARRAGLTVTLQTTVIGSLTDKNLAGIMRFALDCKDIEGIQFQPIVFTGRDQLQPAAERVRKRYTLARLASDLQDSANFDWQPLRDWLPFSAVELFQNCMEMCGIHVVTPSGDLHPRHGQFSLLLQNVHTGAVAPITSIIDAPQFLAVAPAILRRLPGEPLRRIAAASLLFRYCRLSRLRSIGLPFWTLVSMYRECMPRSGESSPTSQRREWRLLKISGIWFQDLFNLDLDAKCRSCARVASQEGEFSFCSYNSEMGRQTVESRWGVREITPDRAMIYANGNLVPLPAPRSQSEPRCAGEQICSGVKS
jgi:7,8-dihydro-6-hydroxymethylpterin dimethyltransferase